MQIHKIEPDVGLSGKRPIHLRHCLNYNNTTYKTNYKSNYTNTSRKIMFNLLPSSSQKSQEEVLTSGYNSVLTSNTFNQLSLANYNFPAHKNTKIQNNH